MRADFGAVLDACFLLPMPLAEVIVTYNKQDFPEAALEPFGIKCKGPSAFLRDLYYLEPSIVTLKLTEQAENLEIPIGELLKRLKKVVPSFTEFICEELQIEL